MRDSRTDAATFRAALNELTTMLVYEAARAFAVDTYLVVTPVSEATGTRLANPPLIVPVLRAGLGMANAALALLPESSMGFVGLARDEHTFQPRAYMESLPTDLPSGPGLVLVPTPASRCSPDPSTRLLPAAGRLRLPRYHGLLRARRAGGHRPARPVRPAAATRGRGHRSRTQRERLHRPGPGRRGRPAVRWHAQILIGRSDDAV